MTITSLATSTVSWTVTHPSIDRAHGCVTSVIGPRMVAPCQRGMKAPKRKLQNINPAVHFKVPPEIRPAVYPSYDFCQEKYIIIFTS